MDKNKILDEIFKNDPLGLLNVKPQSSATRSADERLLASFQEINGFVEKNEREPEPNAGNISEYQLYSRLKSLREDEQKMLALEPEDKYGLLKVEKKEINSIDDIFNDDALDILGDDSEGLFSYEHIPKETNMPDYIAQRKPCKDFAKFEPKFVACQADLANGERVLLPFKNEQQIDKGYFFILKGVLLYIAKVGKRKMDKGGKGNARLRCIFENGTESDMLLRSLAAELYKDGRRVTEHEDRLLDNFRNITEEDEESGFIYVVKSKSKKLEIKNIRHLYKIGYSTTAVENRVKNAEKEPTYLMAPVEIVGVWQCYNMNPQRLEQLLHNFFGGSCLEVDIFDGNGKRYMPREWFIAPFGIIERVIELIISGRIVEYQYDVERMVIVGQDKS